MSTSTDPGKSLNDLALTVFEDLSETELELLEAIAAGQSLFIAKKLGEDDQHSSTAIVSATNPIRAALLTWMCTDNAARSLITHSGIQIQGAYIEGSLDLSRSRLDFNLSLLNCIFTTSPVLASSEIDMLDLRRSSFPGIDCRWIRVKNGAYFSQIHCEGKIVISNSDIRVIVDFSGASIQNEDDVAIDATSIRIDGDLLFHETFHSEGAVYLSGASISGNVSFVNGLIDQSQGLAILADGVQVGGEFNVAMGFHTNGEVRIPGAAIGGSICFSGATLSNPGKRALNAQRAHSKLGVFLNRKFMAEGEVRLMELTTDGNLDCSNSTFKNEGATAIQADGITTQGAVFLNNGFAASGETRFVGARIAGQVSCEKGSFNNPQKDALQLDGARVDGLLIIGRGFRSKGRTHISGSRIGLSVICSNGLFENPGGMALSADGVCIGASLNLNKEFKAIGEVSVLNSKIGGQLECSGGEFLNSEGFALCLDGSYISGSCFLRGGARVEGLVSFVHVNIAQGLAITNLRSAEKMTLDLTSAKVGTLWDEENSWPRSIELDGFRYERLDSNAPHSADARLRWLSLQPQFRPQPYKCLASVLQDMGHDETATAILIAKENRHRLQLNERKRKYSSWNWFWYNLPFRLIGYGYKPANAFIWGLLFVIAGTLLFKKGYEIGAVTEINTSSGGAQTAQYSDTYPAFSPFMYSVDAFVPIIDFGQEPYWTPNPHRAPIRGLATARVTPQTYGSLVNNWGWWLRTYLWCHIAAGWVLTTLLVLGFTGVVRR